jgi:F0F1-type ATP synthase membrane subunit b/b'
MEHIDPSHFVALSFFIFISILIRKRFFNVGAILDAEINAIKEKIRNGEENHKAALAYFDDMGMKLGDVDAQIAEIIENGDVRCTAMATLIRDEIAAEILLKKSQYALQAKYLEERFQKSYQQALIVHIFKILKDQLVAHIHSESRDAFYEHQLEQSLGLVAKAAKR